MKAGLAAVLVLGARLLVHAETTTNSVGDLSPTEALKAFETEPGFIVELVAAEPLVMDPVAIAFDEHGRLFVAENRDYPTGAADGKALGVIAVLEDQNRDGRMDARMEFASGIRFPNGVLPWRGGVIVTAAPDVWWLADRDGDGQAEVKELLLTGFDASSTSQLRANDPTLGPGGWVYIAGGLRGGKVHSPKRPGVVLDLAKGDLRFRPDTGEMELTEGKSQFGLAFDHAGNRFACMNRVQVQHAPLAFEYLERNPFVNPPGVLQNCPEIEANTLMTRYTAGAARYYPISANITTADSHVGTYSAACAVHIYRGNDLPEEYWGAAFSCDPTGNLVRGDRLEKRGGSFAAIRIREGSEALRSRDNWFRPVFIADGPDGALYIADMYRKVIEHPEYLPEEVRKHTDFEAGRDKGRIWRLRGGEERSAPERSMAGAGMEDLVNELSSNISWRRDTAFRLLAELADHKAAPALKEAFGKAREEGTAVMVLDLLDQFGAVDEAILADALRHEEPGVRRLGLRLGEERLGESTRVRELVLRCAKDADPQVRFQAALTLGELEGKEKVAALLEIAEAQGVDEWTRAAIQLSLRSEEELLAMARRICESEEKTEEELLAVMYDTARQFGLRSKEKENAAAEKLRETIANGSVEGQIAAWAGFIEGGGRIAGKGDFDTIFAAARKICGDPKRTVGQRLQAIRFLALDRTERTMEILRQRLVPAEPAEVQVEAVRALLEGADARAAASLVAREHWRGYAPALRTVLLNYLSSRESFAGVLLDAIEHGDVPAAMLTPGNRNALRKSRSEQVRTRAAKLLAGMDGDRAGAFERAKASLALTGKGQAGRTVFQTHCSACHRLNQEGVAVGPDLFDIRNQPKESILYHIVVPEAEIAPNFVSYECETKDGRTLSGLLASESGASITLRMAQGVEETIPRSEILNLTASAVSLMPQELERAMTPQEMADLLAYLRGEQ